MGRKLLPASAAALMLLALTGCGTLLNVAGKGSTPFGGVAVDGYLAGYPVTSACGLCEKCSEFGEPPTTLVLAFYAIVDLPFSAIADVITLPAVLHAKYLDRHDNEAPEESGGTERPVAKVAPATTAQPSPQ